MHISALTFGTLLSSQESDAHRASDFRLKLRGNSPNFTVSSGAGQIGLFRPSPPARLSDRKPAEACFGYLVLQGVCRSCRPLSRPAPRSNKKNITDIRGEDANRGSGPCPGSLQTTFGTGEPAPTRSSDRPSGHSTHSRLRERHSHHPAPLKRFSRAIRSPRGPAPYEMPCTTSYRNPALSVVRRLTKWEPVDWLPLVTSCTAQQTPLGEWPLVAA